MTPSEAHQRNVDEGFLPDPTQFAAVAELDDLHIRLQAAEVGTKPQSARWWRRFLADSKTPVAGLYLWGGVGRGKTYLMDLFFDCLPFEHKQRTHFHRFMQRVHAELTELSGIANPLHAVADSFARDGNVLCFDEFFVSDIGDAMILAELLDALFERGVTLVATSNVEPGLLYENGLQRRRFLPAIDLIARHMKVFNLDGDIDYRLRVLERSETYHTPLDERAEDGLRECFAALAPETPVLDVTIVVNDRPIVARQKADDVVWFEFAEICDGPRSQNDYVELSKIFHAVVISGVPRFDGKTEDQARRFIGLIDEFYDRRVKVILSAAEPIGRLYQGSRLSFEFERTKSRIHEMQSTEYLARGHKA